MSIFITFEGGEGSGKSTQAKALYRKLCKMAIPALLTHEPGVTTLGRKVARLLKWTQNVDISPTAELMLFNSSRAQLTAEVIKPGLESGKVVICDRYADSTTAYQGYGRRIDLNVVAEVNRIGTMGLRPDITFLLDMPVEKGLARKDGNKDRFEVESIKFHRRIREGYLKLAAAEPERWLVIDAEKSIDEIADIIWQRVSKLLPRAMKLV
jgi:dTMP kinase